MVANVNVAHALEGLNGFNYDRFELCKEKLKKEIVRLCSDGIYLNKSDVLSVYQNETGENDKDAGNIYFYKIKYRTYQYRKGQLIITYWLNDVL